jgi:hypothetical protein
MIIISLDSWLRYGFNFHQFYCLIISKIEIGEIEKFEALRESKGSNVPLKKTV